MPAGGPEQSAPYRPRHARSLDARRIQRTAAAKHTGSAPDDDAVKAPGIAALFRRNPERARRTAVAAGAVAVCVLVASSVASAATRTGSHDGAPVAKSVGLGGHAVPKTPENPATTTEPGSLSSARMVSAKQMAPATKAVIKGLAGNGIPNVALNAYRVAADRMAHVQPSCGIDWALLAGIGREESDHGQFAGARLNPDGTSTPRIIGPALNGVGNQYIAAPANGFALDGDAKYTHALGPMQFIPQTWAGYGADANGDGKADIFNINDAALGAARYLCANGGNLRTAAGQERAILAYNHSDQYLAQVLALSDAYRLGIPVKGIPVGNITGALPPITATGPYAVNPGPPTAASSSKKTRGARFEAPRLGYSVRIDRRNRRRHGLRRRYRVRWRSGWRIGSHSDAYTDADSHAEAGAQADADPGPDRWLRWWWQRAAVADQVADQAADKAADEAPDHVADRIQLGDTEADVHVCRRSRRHLRRPLTHPLPRTRSLADPVGQGSPRSGVARGVGEHAQTVDDAAGQIAVAERCAHRERGKRAGAVRKTLRGLFAGHDVQHPLAGRDREQDGRRGEPLEQLLGVSAGRRLERAHVDRERQAAFAAGQRQRLVEARELA